MAIGLLLGTLFAFSDPDPAAKVPEFVIDTRGTNSVTARIEKDQTVFVVMSERGIGWADIKLKSGTWPDRITFRFGYSAEKGFRSLEGFNLTTDQIVVKGSDKDSGKMLFTFLDANGKPDVTELRSENAAGKLDVRIEHRDGGLEVILPARMLRKSSKLWFGWVDAYRR